MKRTVQESQRSLEPVRPRSLVEGLGNRGLLGGGTINGGLDEILDPLGRRLSLSPLTLPTGVAEKFFSERITSQTPHWQIQIANDALEKRSPLPVPARPPINRSLRAPGENRGTRTIPQSDRAPLTDSLARELALDRVANHGTTQSDMERQVVMSSIERASIALPDNGLADRMEYVQAHVRTLGAQSGSSAIPRLTDAPMAMDVPQANLGASPFVRGRHPWFPLDQTTPDGAYRGPQRADAVFPAPSQIPEAARRENRQGRPMVDFPQHPGRQARSGRRLEPTRSEDEVFEAERRRERKRKEREARRLREQQLREGLEAAPAESLEYQRA